MGKKIFHTIKEMVESLELELLSRHTSFAIGGPAEIMVFPKNETELLNVLSMSYGKIPLRFLARGTNILAPDEGVKGITVNLARMNDRHIEISDTIAVGGGFSVFRFIKTLMLSGISGFEFLAGIPGTIGGAVAMNAGALGKSIGEYVVEVKILSLKYPFDTCVLHRNELGFGYRTFSPDVPGIVTSVKLSFGCGNSAEIKRKILEILADRKSKQPLGLPSAGCVFKNPKGTSAGRLIEDMGMKGYTKGGALVSEVHANFIVNKGNALASDVMFVIDAIKEKAIKEYGVELLEEIKNL